MDLDEEEEDPEIELDEEDEDPKMELDEEEEDPEMEVDDEEEEEPLPASSPPLHLKSPLSTYEVGEPSSIASALVFSARYELNQLRQEFGILGSRWDIPELMNGSTATGDRLTMLKKDQDSEVEEPKIRLEVASVDRYRLEYELYSERAQMHAIQQELYWRGFEENRPTKSIDVLATYGDADPPELQEPADTQ
ncbi:hypothetical protein Tco_0934572 [Tanacetum coccineum]